jgi:hypothetical protein
MNIQNRLDTWINATHTANQNITKLLNSEEKEFSELVRFILESEINPWQYLPSGWEGSLYSAQNTESLLNTIHHALVDDGDMCWINTDIHGPFLAFIDKWDEEGIEKLVGKRFEHSYWKVEYTVHGYSSKFIDTLLKFERERSERAERLERNRLAKLG